MTIEHNEIKNELLNTILSSIVRYYIPEYHLGLINPGRVDLIARLLELLQTGVKTLENISVLDVGCGNCDLLLLLRELGIKELVAVNLFPLNEAVFKSKMDDIFGEEVNQIKYLELDVDKDELPFPSGRFDCVLFFDVIEHLYDPAFALGEISRVLARDGYLVMKTPNGANLAKRARLMLGKSPYHELKGWLWDYRFVVPRTSEKKFQGHIREYTFDELKWMLNTFRLRPVFTKLYPVHSQTPRFSWRLYNLIEKMFPRFAYQIGIIAEAR